MANNIIDQQVRAVDIGKSNVAIGFVHRTQDLATPGEVAEHDLVSEVYHIISGSATLVTGPELVGARAAAGRQHQRPPAEWSRPQRQVGAQRRHAPAEGRRRLVIPAGTGHWFTKIDDHITYLMIRDRSRQGGAAQGRSGVEGGSGRQETR